MDDGRVSVGAVAVRRAAVNGAGGRWDEFDWARPVRGDTGKLGQPQQLRTIGPNQPVVQMRAIAICLIPSLSSLLLV